MYKHLKPVQQYHIIIIKVLISNNKASTRSRHTEYQEPQLPIYLDLNKYSYTYESIIFGKIIDNHL